MSVCGVYDHTLRLIDYTYVFILIHYVDRYVFWFNIGNDVFGDLERNIVIGFDPVI